MPGLRDDEVAASTSDPRGLAEDRLDVALSRHLRDAPLGLRHRLLRDNDHVTVLEATRALDRVTEKRREIVALAELRDAGERQDLDQGATLRFR